MSNAWSIKERKEYSRWLEEKQSIERAVPSVAETSKDKEGRIKELLDNYDKFCRYYFGHMIDSDLSWFHKKAAKEVKAAFDLFLIAEWPREHAKSVHFDVFVPMWLKARGELTGMMIASANEKKAAGLLGDVQAELMFNKRYIADFGEQYSLGNWQDGHFATADGTGFWAFGRGQSPRGTRKSAKRPNYGVVDDIDDASIVKNESRVDEAVDWVLGDFYGAMPNTGSRLVIAGNRIHKKSILAKLVGDVEPDDPKRQGIVHIKVFALENPKTRKKDTSTKGVPAWKERYTRDHIIKKMTRMGWRLGLREFFHEHVVIGRVFKEEDLVWAHLPALTQYEQLLTYNDPSFKGTKKNDYKAIVLMGRIGRYFDIIAVFCRQCTTPEMIRGHFRLADLVPANMNCKHYMEANFMQDMLLDEYYKEGENNGIMLPIRGDRRKKPEKEARIENLTPFTEQHIMRFNAELKQDPDMQVLRDQFLGFPDYDHDDGPDAVEGGTYILNRGGGGRRKRGDYKSGRYNYSNSSSRRTQ